MVARVTLVAASIATALSMLAPMALAQNDAGSALVAPREGDTYGYKDHQPTEVAPSAETYKQVNDEVKALLKQADELDRQSEQWALPDK